MYQSALAASAVLLPLVFAQDCDPSTNLLLNGGFELGFGRPWRGYRQPQTFPGWLVTAGSVDLGDYVTTGHCTEICAVEGESFLDICGFNSGAVSQQMTDLIVGATYHVSLRYSAHGDGCGQNGLSQSAVYMLDDIDLDTVTHAQHGSWNLRWGRSEQTFVATATTHNFSLASISNGCGCIIFDDVKVNCMLPAPTSSTTPASTTARPDVNALVDTVQTLITRIQTLEGNVSSLRAEVDILNAVTSQHDTDISSALNDIEALANDVSGNQQAVSQIRSAFANNSMGAVGTSRCNGDGCKPSLKTDADNNMNINALGGDVLVASDQCGQFSLCDLRRALQGTTDSV